MKPAENPNQTEPGSAPPTHPLPLKNHLRRLTKTLLIATLLLTAMSGGLWYWHHLHYPYGSTHRCSKILTMHLVSYANEHQGQFPQPTHENQLGLDLLFTNLGTDDSNLELIVGKAGNPKKARNFYQNHGYLKPEHSSWHYIPGLTTADLGRALAWDNPPLTHNGQKIDSNPREVLLISEGSVHVQVITEAQWPEFLAKQNKLAANAKKAISTAP